MITKYSTITVDSMYIQRIKNSLISFLRNKANMISPGPPAILFTNGITVIFKEVFGPIQPVFCSLTLSQLFVAPLCSSSIMISP